MPMAERTPLSISPRLTYHRGGARAPPPNRAGSGRKRPARSRARAAAVSAGWDARADQRQPGTNRMLRLTQLADDDLVSRDHDLDGINGDRAQRTLSRSCAGERLGLRRRNRTLTGRNERPRGAWRGVVMTINAAVRGRCRGVRESDGDAAAVGGQDCAVDETRVVGSEEADSAGDLVRGGAVPGRHA